MQSCRCTLFWVSLPILSYPSSNFDVSRSSALQSITERTTLTIKNDCWVWKSARPERVQWLRIFSQKPHHLRCAHENSVLFTPDGKDARSRNGSRLVCHCLLRLAWFKIEPEFLSSPLCYAQLSGSAEVQWHLDLVVSGFYRNVSSLTYSFCTAKLRFDCLLFMYFTKLAHFVLHPQAEWPRLSLIFNWPLGARLHLAFCTHLCHLHKSGSAPRQIATLKKCDKFQISRAWLRVRFPTGWYKLQLRVMPAMNRAVKDSQTILPPIDDFFICSISATVHSIHYDLRNQDSSYRQCLDGSVEHAFENC